jgi:Protein of unknown function (DUF2894)
MQQPDHPDTPWGHRIQAIDAQAAMRCAPVSWQVIQRLSRHGEKAGVKVSESVHQRLLWHVEHVERQIANQQPPGQSAEVTEPIQWPQRHTDLSQPLSTCSDMRQWHAGFQIRQQLQRSLSQPLQHAGPLHSERLVQQSLALLTSISSAYLHRLLSHVDALAALEDAGKPRAVKSAAPKSRKTQASLKPPA